MIKDDRKHNIVIIDTKTKAVVKRIDNLTAAEQTHLYNQVIDINPEHEQIIFDAE